MQGPVNSVYLLRRQFVLLSIVNHVTSEGLEVGGNKNVGLGLFPRHNWGDKGRKGKQLCALIQVG